MTGVPIYLDASALVRWVEADVASPSARNLSCAAPVAAVCSAETPVLGLSELTIMEFHNTVISCWRAGINGHATYAGHDQSWAEQSQLKLMRLVADRRVEVRGIPAWASEQALALVTVATRDHGNGLQTWDAVHLIVAARWALELGVTVELWTSDSDFGRFVELFPHFKRFVQVRNLDS